MAEERPEPSYSTESIPEIKKKLHPFELVRSLSDGKCVLSCGHAFVGEEGFQVRVASILQLTPDKKGLIGWAFQHRLDPYGRYGEYENEGFHRINGKGPPKARLPDTFFHIVAEVNESLVEEKSEQRVKEIMSWSLDLIDNDGVPKGVLQDVRY